jgi:hypothetical protein
VKYGYAIIANWEGTEPEQHPSNAPEAVALSVIDQSDLYYVEPLTKGGTLKLDLSVWNWYSHPVGGVMQDYRVFFESNILSSVYQFNSAEMTPVGGGENYSTYHVEIEPVNLTGVDGNELWVIVEQQGLDYTNEFGTVNLAGEDKLAALFRYGLYVSPIHECPDPTVTGINPDRLLTDVPYNDVEITGTDFLEGPYLAAKLVKAGQPDIIGTDVKHIDDTKITADFNLAGAAVGFWDVVVTNGCGSVGTGLGLVEIYSCGDMSALSSQWIWHVVDLLFDGAYSGTATTQLGTPYVIGVSRNGDVLCALPLAGGATITSPSLGSSMNRDVICDSQNRVYFTDATDYGRVRYIPFLDPPGWGTPVDFGIIESPWSIYRITIDENDNPVLLATSGNAMRVFHWNSGSADWDWTPVPAAVGTPGMIGDFDYNPIQHHYLLVQRYTPMRTDLHVVDKEGNLVTTLQDIFQGNTYSVLPGLAVDVEDSSCRIVAWGPYNEFWTLPSPFARINASYTDRKFALLQGVPQGGGSYLNIASPRGQFSHSNHCLVVAVHYINVWGEVPLPADW